MKPSLEYFVTGIRIDTGDLAARLSEPPADLVQELASIEHPREAQAVVEVLCRAIVGTMDGLAASHLKVAADWGRGQVPGGNLFLAALMQLDPEALEIFWSRMKAEVPEAVALLVSGTIFFSPEKKGAMIEAIASDPRPGVREHLFALYGGHRRIVPPGSLTSPILPDAVHMRIVRRGVADPVAKVRERAIAYAYGRGVVEWVRDLVEAAAAGDQDVDVRQYALVALGLLGDQRSLEILRAALRGDGVPEIKSAIWALARRPDGLADIVALAADARAWVRDEVVGAIGEVSAPLSDEQMKSVAATIATPAITQALARHIARTQRGLAERGPDGLQISVVRSAERPLSGS